eukprot:8866160-Prorocentrum_lima.AAC.1
MTLHEEYPDALTKEVHKLDSPEEKNWAAFYHGLTTRETLECLSTGSGSGRNGCESKVGGR